MTDANAQRVVLDGESVATRVTLFEDRAEVQRSVEVVAPREHFWVRVSGLGVALDDASLVASVRGEGGRVVGHEVQRVVRDVYVLDEAARAEAERAHDAARDGHAQAEARCEALRREAGWIGQAIEAWFAGVAAVPRGGEGAPGAGASQWAEALAALEAEMKRVNEALAAQLRALDAAARQLSQAVAAWRVACRQVPRVEATLVLQVAGDLGKTLLIEMSYRTPCALWRPEHLARLVTRDGAPVIAFESWATVWQSTGERWDDVALRFSTARPAQSATPPLETDDVLRTRRKTEAERQNIQVSLREQTVAVAGLDRGARVVDEMPGVDDGGEALWFAPEGAARVPSDGAPHRVLLQRFELPCVLERVAMPEKGETVHLRATATLRGVSTPLLAGPVQVAREATLVGRGRVDFVARGEPFELGFGVEDGVRVRRRVEDKREVTVVMGTQKLVRTVKVTLSNLSDEARTVLVVERFPVSELDEVRVFAPTDPGWSFEARDGLARAAVTLEPRATHALSLTWRLEASNKVQLPFA